MAGIGAHELDMTRRDSVPNKATLVANKCLPITDWKTAADLSLTASTSPRLELLSSVITVMTWIFSDAAANAGAIQFTMPNEWAGDSAKQRLKLWVPARKLDAGADENATLKLQCRMFWVNPPAATSTSRRSASPSTSTYDATHTALTTAPSQIIAAAANHSATAGFIDYEFDLGARLIAESKQILPGATVKLWLGPDTTVGTTDMKLQVMTPRLIIAEHSAAFDISKR